MKWPKWLLKLAESVLPARSMMVIEGEELPVKLPRRDLLLLRDGGEDWSVAMRCPCGCGQKVELALIPEAKPRWKLRLEPDKSPTLSPSVWLREGCCSHFFVRRGKVEWAESNRRH